MELWPAIDILGGQCVRLKQGDYRQETVYGSSPAAMAEHWVRCGAGFLHVVDLDGAKDKRPINRLFVKEILDRVSIPVEIGGGVRTEETIRDYLDMGIHRIVIGTLALKEPDWFREMSRKFPGRLVLGIDAKNGRVATEGWLETSQTTAVSLAQAFSDLPLAAIVYTDIARDGMLEGPNFDEMETMNRAASFPVVASGGVSSLEDLRRLKALGLPACIIGKALYESAFRLEDALKVAQ